MNFLKTDNLFIYTFHKYLSSSDQTSGTMLKARDRMLNKKTDAVPEFMGLRTSRQDGP